MKPSGQHKHDKKNELGKHTHNFDELGEEGIKLLVKGNLENIPEISFKKPKSEKEKKEAKEKKETKKENKKNELNQLVEEIEKNFEKFQGTKQIAQQQTQQQIPIYIPQYTEPTGRNLNVGNLTEINNMILEKENELREYYEEQFKEKWSEIEDNYKILEDKALEEDKEIAFRDPILPQTNLTPPPIYQQEEEPPKFIDDFEVVQKPSAELTPSQEFEYETPRKSFADNVVDLLEIFDDEMLNKYKNINKKNETLKEINEEQDKLINSKQTQLDQLNETIKIMEQSVNLSKNDINKLENELINKMNEIQNLTDENEKLQKMKEAEILSLQLNSSEDINELQEQLQKVKDEKKETQQELETLKLLNTKIDSDSEDLQDINISPAEEQLINFDLDNDSRTLLLRQYLPSNLIPKQKNRMIKLYEIMVEILNRLGNDDGLRNEIKTILNNNSNITQTNFITQLSEIFDAKRFVAEEQLQNQIISERVAEAENEEFISIINEIDEQLITIQNEFNELQNRRKSRVDEIKEFESNLEELIDEYETLIFTLETAFSDAGINNINEINIIDDEHERENLIALNNYIIEQKETIQPFIEEIKDKLLTMKLELDKLEIELKFKKEDINITKKRSDNAKKRLL
jgi:hypothetical protein